MSASPVIIAQKPILANADTLVHTANNLRRITDTLGAVGVMDFDSWRVRQQVSGAAMSVDVTTAAVASQAYIRGGSTTLQGLYLVTNVAQGTGTIDALYNVNIAASDPTNPRIDQVYLCVEDAQHAGSNNQATIRVVTGTPTGGATLDNRTGVGAAPAGMSSILIADVLVAAAVGTILTAAIRDRRRVCNVGTVPWLGSTGTQVDMVFFEPNPGVPLNSAATLSQASGHALNQAAALMWLPRRIVGATRLRWRYFQGATAIAVNWNIGIYDASGRTIVETGAVAFAGAANSATEVSAAISATTLEAGWYYLLVGVGALGAGSSARYWGVGPDAGGTTTVGAMTRNLVFYGVGAGTSLGTTILAYTDIVTVGAQSFPPIPVVALSVG